MNTRLLFFMLPQHVSFHFDVCISSHILQHHAHKVMSSNIFVCVFGSPISWMCEKQSSVSHSSTESEIISLDAGLRLDGIRALDLWSLFQSLETQSRPTIERGNPLFAVMQVTHKASNLEECSFCWCWLCSLQRHFRIKKFCCMCLRTTKQWWRWSWKAEVQQWDMFPGPTELRFIGCSIESIRTLKSKSSTPCQKPTCRLF